MFLFHKIDVISIKIYRVVFETVRIKTGQRQHHNKQLTYTIYVPVKTYQSHIVAILSVFYGFHR